MNTNPAMYSQNDEERFIVDALDGVTNGHFLDIGAYDGKTFSNTLRLVEKGWSGVCVDPSPSVFQRLLALHGGNDRIRCLNMAVIPVGPPSLMRFHDCGGDAVSTLSDSHRALWSSNLKFTPFFVYPIALSDLMAQLAEDWHFVNIDVEGTNIPLFERFVELYRGSKLRCISVEYEGRAAHVIDLGSKLGMTHYHVTTENVVLWK